jgi:hypothetical protein
VLVFEEPPTTTIDPEDRPDYVLHPLRGAVLATFLGTPTAAGIVLAINFARVGRTTAAWNSVAIGFLSTVAVIAVALLVPDNWHIPAMVYQIPILWGVFTVASQVQGPMVREHAARGGQFASLWGSAGIGIACGVVIAAAVAGGVLFPLLNQGPSIAFGEDEVYYSKGATEADARKIGEALQEIGYFGSKGAAVRVETPEGKYEISFVVIDGTWDDPEMVSTFGIVGKHLALNVLHAPFTLHLSDDEFRSRKAIPISLESEDPEP